MSEVLGVKGLAEFNRSLKRLDSELPKGLRIALNDCSDFLIQKTVPLIPKKTGRAAGSLKARSSRTAVRIGVGGSKAPWYPWLDFGGEGKRKGRPSRREFIKEGRYLYPTLRTNRDHFSQILQGSLEKTARAAGLEVD